MISMPFKRAHLIPVVPRNQSVIPYSKDFLFSFMCGMNEEQGRLWKIPLWPTLTLVHCMAHIDASLGSSCSPSQGRRIRCFIKSPFFSFSCQCLNFVTIDCSPQALSVQDSAAREYWRLPSFLPDLPHPGSNPRPILQQILIVWGTRQLLSNDKTDQ